MVKPHFNLFRPFSHKKNYGCKYILYFKSFNLNITEKQITAIRVLRNVFINEINVA